MQEGTKGTSPGQELIMTLIPENVQGPDGVVSPLRRIFYHQASFQTYQESGGKLILLQRKKWIWIFLRLIVETFQV